MVNEEQPEPPVSLPPEQLLALMVSKKLRGCDLKVALAMLLFSRDRPDGEGIAVSQKRLIKLTGYSRSEVSEALASLDAEGVITQKQRATVDGRPGVYAFNKDFEHWGKYSVDRLEVLGFLKRAPAEPAAGEAVETPPGVLAGPTGVFAGPTGVFAPPESYVTSLESEEEETIKKSSPLIEEGLNEQRTGELPKPTAQTILPKVVWKLPQGVYLDERYKGRVGWQIKQLLEAGENPDFIKEAARRLVLSCQPRHNTDPRMLPSFLADVKRERKNWPESGPILWDERQPPTKTLDELVGVQDRPEQDQPEEPSPQEDAPRRSQHTEKQLQELRNLFKEDPPGARQPTEKEWQMLRDLLEE